MIMERKKYARPLYTASLPSPLLPSHVPMCLSRQMVQDRNAESGVKSIVTKRHLNGGYVDMDGNMKGRVGIYNAEGGVKSMVTKRHLNDGYVDMDGNMKGRVGIYNAESGVKSMVTKRHLNDGYVDMD